MSPYVGSCRLSGSGTVLWREKHLDSNPDVVTDKLGDLGQVTQTLSLNFFLSNMGLVIGLVHSWLQKYKRGTNTCEVLKQCQAGRGS